MNYQRQSSNGNTIEQINGKFYINGIETETGKTSALIRIRTFFITVAAFLLGLFVGGAWL